MLHRAALPAAHGRPLPHLHSRVPRVLVCCIVSWVLPGSLACMRVHARVHAALPASPRQHTLALPSSFTATIAAAPAWTIVVANIAIAIHMLTAWQVRAAWGTSLTVGQLAGQFCFE